VFNDLRVVSQSISNVHLKGISNSLKFNSMSLFSTTFNLFSTYLKQPNSAMTDVLSISVSCMAVKTLLAVSAVLALLFFLVAFCFIVLFRPQARCASSRAPFKSCMRALSGEVFLKSSRRSTHCFWPKKASSKENVGQSVEEAVSVSFCFLRICFWI